MRQNGHVLASILAQLQDVAEVGVSGDYLEKLALKLIEKKGGLPSFRGFHNYPYALCFSINDEIVHAAPLENKIIKEGNLVSLDLGFYKDNFHSDMAVSFIVGGASGAVNKLLKVTKKALDEAIKVLKPDIKLGEISHLIQNTIESEGFSVIKELTGHGIGKDLHEEPHVFNYGKPDSGPTLKEGMVLAIEPMASLGSDRIKEGKDGFAYITKDNALSAHFEHTVLVTKNGAEVLTKLD